MKSLKFILILLTIIITGQLIAEDAAILEIREYYQKVQKQLKTLKQSKVDYTHKKNQDEETDLLEEEIYYYSDKKGVVRIVGDMVFDCSGKVNELTYKDKKLVFIYTYQWMGCNREGINSEIRYYFKDGKLIRWKEGNGEDSIKPVTKAKEAELLKLSEFYLKLK